jgi:hypothetical protein
MPPASTSAVDEAIALLGGSGEGEGEAPRPPHEPRQLAGVEAALSANLLQVVDGLGGESKHRQTSVCGRVAVVADRPSAGCVRAASRPVSK